MAGAPSHLDLFDHKPKLAEFEGQPIPPSIIGGQRYAFIRSDAAVLGPRFRFVATGRLRYRDRRHPAALRQDRRRRVFDPLDAHRSVQPRAGPDFSQHRRRAAGPPEPRLVGRLRSGGPDERFAGLRRDVDRIGNQRRSGQLVQRHVADRLHGCAFSQPGRPDPERVATRRREPPIAARHTRPGARRSIAAGSTSSAIPKSPRGSPPTRWPTAWRLRPPS